MILQAIVLFSSTFFHAAFAKDVFAHFMAQNSYSYDQSDWANDISTASAIGIDGFALNLAANDYEVSKINDAYAAAEAHQNFKLFYSFDMSYTWDVSTMAGIVAQHATSPSTYRWNGNILVSSFAGESQGDAFWSSLKSTLSARGLLIILAPAFTSYRDPSNANALLSNFPSIDGFFNWWSWPADNGNLLTTDTDLAYQNVIKTRSGPYIMSVSPWQFKELGGTQDWVELSDTLWKYRWEQAINDVKPDIVEIVTWNDYAESHYISDINPKVNLGEVAPNYVNGFVHAPWRIIAQYYISSYKTGSSPTISKDQVVFWYRSHPKDAQCNGGDRPRNSQYPADAVFAFALLTSPATVTLDIGSNHYQWDAAAGISMGQVAFPTEDAQIPYIQIIRNGQKIQDGYGSTYVTNSCSFYNFNPFVGVIG